MGLFSWITSDTNESIRVDGPRPVYLLQPGSLPNIEQDVYGGYGVFGGVDAFVWLGLINEYADGGPVEDFNWKALVGVDDQDLRVKGIYFPDDQITYPLKFSYNKDAVYEELKASDSCPDQGFFYDDDEDEDDYCPECGRSY